MPILAAPEKPVRKASAQRKVFPAELERILMRALERDTTRRYGTSAEMARDLETFLGRLEQPVGVDDVAAMMSDVFADQIEFRNGLLYRGSVESALEVIDNDLASSSSLRNSAPYSDPAYDPPPPSRF